MKHFVAVLPAAGRGSRMRPMTLAYPKEGLFYDGDFLINHVLRSARDCGVSDMIVVTGYRKGALIDMVGSGPEGMGVEFVVQEELKGLGHAVLCAERSVSHLNSNFFAVFLGDDLVVPSDSIKKMFDSHPQNFFGSVLVERVKNPSNFGVVKLKNFDGLTGEIIDMIEKPNEQERVGFDINGDFFVISAVYLLSKDIFGYLKRTPPGKNGEIQLTDAMKLALLDGKRFRAFVLDGKRLDFGNWRSYVKNMKDYWCNLSIAGEEALINRLEKL